MAGDDRSSHSTPARCVAAKTWHREPLYSSLVAHLRLKYSPSLQLETHLPPSSTVERAIILWLWPVTSSLGHTAAWFTSFPTALSPHAALWVQGPQPGGSHPSGNTLWRPRDTWTSTCAICEWNPAVNKPSGPSSALRLQLGLQHLLFYLALLNCPCLDCNPRGTAWKNQRLLTIYNRMMPAQIFTWYLTSGLPVVLRSRFGCSTARRSSKSWTLWNKQLIFESEKTRGLSTEKWHFHHSRTLKVSWERSHTNTILGVAGQVVAPPSAATGDNRTFLVQSWFSI